MFDTTKFDFSFRPDLQLPDNDGKFWILNEDDELEEYDGSHLSPGTGSDGKERIIYNGEEEVAYMALETALGNDCWVTMHRDGIDYRLVSRTEIPESDELQTAEPHFKAVPTLGELLHALDHMTNDFPDVADGWVQGNIPGLTISEMGSPYYPQLEKWYFSVQDHYFMTGELIYVDDPLGERVKIVKHADPQPERMAEKVPGSGSFFAAPKNNPGLIEKMFRLPEDNKP